MLSQKLLLRAAGHLHASFLAMVTYAGTQEQASIGTLANGQRYVGQTIRQLERARRRGLSLIVPRLRESLLAQVKGLQEAVQFMHTSLEQPLPPVPDLRTLVAEVRQLEAEFDQVQLDFAEKRLTVTTESITLQNVYLGAFAIRLHWQRLPAKTGVDCFTILALDPHPAISDGRVTHPHVKSEHLCAGDAKIPLQRALEQGRLADAFCLIRSVLTHYNSASPHVALKGWEGDYCQDCGCCIGGDDTCYCPGCQNDFCNDCSRECKVCSSTRCLDCLTRCTVCEDACCSRCLRASTRSDEECCPSCLRSCPGCGALVSKEELSATARLCPACQPPDLPAEATAHATNVPTSTPQSTYPEEDYDPTEEWFPPADL